MKYIFTIFTVVLLVSAVLADMHSDFEDFKLRFGKRYASPEEEAQRLAIFVQNMKIAKLQQAENPQATFGATKFADLTPEEFAARHLAKMPSDVRASLKKSTPTHQVREKSKLAMGNSVNWNTKGAVTPVGNEGQCGSTWAFAAVGCTEGQAAISSKVLTKLSEQYLLDCDSNNQGCNGGLMTNAYEWVLTHNEGIFYTASSWP